MRYIKYLFFAVTALVLITLALANRQIITLRVIPEGLGLNLWGDLSVQVPIFVAIFAGIAIGLLIGFIWEWFREYKYRSDANRQHKNVAQLEREIKRLKREKSNGDDDVLALLDDT